MKYAVFVSLGTEVAGIENPHVYLFVSEDAATAFALQVAVGTGSVIEQDGAWYSADRQQRWDSAEEALMGFQDCLGGSEYLDVYETTVIAGHLATMRDVPRDRRCAGVGGRPVFRLADRLRSRDGTTK